jgi:hypothetical protein
MDSIQSNQGCSVVYATDGELMLGGNNEDYYNPLTKVWFIPGRDHKFGRVYFGFGDYYPQGGMNEQGLFFDGLALDGSFPVDTEGKQLYQGNLTDRAMTECATVDCVVGLFEQYYTRDTWSWQTFFGDASGASAIIEAGTIIRQQGGYQVATNFAQSLTPPEESTCWRYQTAVEHLEGMEELSEEAMRDLLHAVHQDGPTQTLYSNVYDLKKGLVYLYYFHNYEDVVILNLEEELAQGYHAYDLSSLFPPNHEAEEWAKPKLRQYQSLIESRLDASVDAPVLQAYVGTYKIPAGWGPPEQDMTVIAQEQSLFLRFPDYRQHELFPASATDFYHVSFQGSDFMIAYEARFGLDEDRRIEYLELVLGADSIRLDRLGPESLVPEVATPAPTATTAASPTSAPTATSTPTATCSPTATHTDTPTATPSQPMPPTAALVQATPFINDPEEGSDFSWAWLVVPLLILGVASTWLALRQRRKQS